MNEKAISPEITLAEKIKGLPLQPGVYLMKDQFGRIIYVGKAKTLRNRVRSYFQNPAGLPGRTRLLVQKIKDIEITVTGTELEALLLECNLIKKHRPRYNVRLKDDKSYPYVVLDFTKTFPQFHITRRVVFSPNLRYFGPFSSGVQDIARFLLKTFQIRDCSESKFRNRTRPCLNYEIGTCTAPCVGLVSEEEYGKQIREAILFLRGRRLQLLKDFKKEMVEASERTEYEKAKALRDKILALEKMIQKQGAVLTDTQQDIDVIGFYEHEGSVQWVVLFVRSGILTGRRAQKVSLGFGTSEDNIRTFLQQFYTVSLIPDELWLSSDFPDRAMLEESLIKQADKKVQIKIPRGERPMRLLGMAFENARLLMHESERNSGESASAELQRVLDLKECPNSIEGIDVSNLQGTKPAVSLVHFADERPLKSRYRLYYPKTVEGQDDFAMIYEIVLRRFSKLDENPPPDLLLIDGGKGQLASAVKALEELKVNIPVCSLAKARTVSGFTLKAVERSEERIFIPYRKNPIILREGNRALALLQRVRDESHRFAIKSHRALRGRVIEESSLIEIPGVGEKTRKKLLIAFGNYERMQKATLEEIVTVGLNRPAAEKVFNFFHPVIEPSERTPGSSEE